MFFYVCCPSFLNSARSTTPLLPSPIPYPFFPLTSLRYTHHPLHLPSSLASPSPYPSILFFVAETAAFRLCSCSTVDRCSSRQPTSFRTSTWLIRIPSKLPTTRACVRRRHPLLPRWAAGRRSGPVASTLKARPARLLLLLQRRPVECAASEPASARPTCPRSADQCRAPGRRSAARRRRREPVAEAAAAERVRIRRRRRSRRPRSRRPSSAPPR